MADYENHNPLITVGDFSKETTKKRVFQMTIEEPITLYSLGVGILGLLGLFLLSGSWFFWLAAVGGSALGGGSWLVNYGIRGKEFEGRYLQILHDALVQERQNKLRMLAGELQKSSHTVPGAEEYASQGAAQFSMVQEKFEKLRELLSQKLNTGELTFIRYAGTVEQVCLSVLDNLQYVASLLKSVSTIDTDHIESQLALLSRHSLLSEADQQKKAALEESKKLRLEQLADINLRLAQNEKALTVIDQSAAEIAKMKVSRGEAALDLETAQQELQRLVKRSYQYQ